MRRAFEERWQFISGRGCHYTTQDQGLATNVSCTFDHIGDGKSESPFSDGQICLLRGFMTQVDLVLCMVPPGLENLPRPLRHQLP